MNKKMQGYPEWRRIQDRRLYTSEQVVKVVCGGLRHVEGCTTMEQCAHIICAAIGGNDGKLTPNEVILNKNAFSGFS